MIYLFPSHGLSTPIVSGNDNRHPVVRCVCLCKLQQKSLYSVLAFERDQGNVMSRHKSELRTNDITIYLIEGTGRATFDVSSCKRHEYAICYYAANRISFNGSKFDKEHPKRWKQRSPQHKMGFQVPGNANPPFINRLIVPSAALPVYIALFIEKFKTWFW